MMKIESVPDAPPHEQELDGELQSVLDYALEILLASASAEAAQRVGDDDGVHEFMRDARIAASSIVHSVQNAARCAGEVIHGEERQAAS